MEYRVGFVGDFLGKLGYVGRVVIVFVGRENGRDEIRIEVGFRLCRFGRLR